LDIDMDPETNKFSYSSTCKAILAFSLLLCVGATNLTAASAGQSCMVSSGSWANSALSQVETGNFRVTYDATPSASTMDAASGVSGGAAQAYTSLAAAAHFNSNGMIDVRNGSGFTAASAIRYSAGVKYHFIFDVNIASHTYNAYVLIGSAQTTLGMNLAFRTEPSGVKSPSDVGVLSALGALSICNIGLSTTPASGTLLLNASANSLNFGKPRSLQQQQSKPDPDKRRNFQRYHFKGLRFWSGLHCERGRCGAYSEPQSDYYCGHDVLSFGYRSPHRHVDSSSRCALRFGCYGNATFGHVVMEFGGLGP
jgi:hypothetical protein